MHAVKREGEEGNTFHEILRSQYVYVLSKSLLEGVACVSGKFLFVFLDRGKSDRVNELDCGTHTDNFSNGGRTGFEAMGRILKDRLFSGDRLNHFSTVEKRRKFIELIVPAPENSCPGWTEYFVRGKCEEVAVNILHVDRDMRSRLGGINDGDNIGIYFFGDPDKFFGRIDRSQNIRGVSERKYLGARRKMFFEFLRVNNTFFIEGNDDKF